MISHYQEAVVVRMVSIQKEPSRVAVVGVAGLNDKELTLQTIVQYLSPV